MALCVARLRGTSCLAPLGGGVSVCETSRVGSPGGLMLFVTGAFKRVCHGCVGLASMAFLQIIFHLKRSMILAWPLVGCNWDVAGKG